MDVKTLCFYILVILIPVATALRRDAEEDRRVGMRKNVHYHTKRHMQSPDLKKRPTTLKPRELRKKPSGHLKPLDEDDMENDEVVSVAVGPPPARIKYDKTQWKHSSKSSNSNNYIPNTSSNYTSAAILVKEVLTQLGREFISHQVNEEFVFGQYIGNAMKNLTADLKLKLQHEILELIVKYQKINNGEVKIEDIKVDKPNSILINQFKNDKKVVSNDTEDTWPDFTNLARIVGGR